MSTTYTAQAIYGIVVQKSDFVKTVDVGRRCDNGHASTAKFCPDCGHPVDRTYDDVAVTPERGAEWEAFASGEFDADEGIGIHFAGSGIWEEPDEDDALIFGRVVVSVCDWLPVEKPLPIQRCDDVDAAIERLGFGGRTPGLFLRMEIA